jgi:arabinogalactan endo-1,4-beta-galactosidase
MAHPSVNTLAGIVITIMMSQLLNAQKPPEAVDITPIDGGTYYLINQHSGLQADSSVPGSGNNVGQQSRSFSTPSQRWVLGRAFENTWEIRSVSNGLCVHSDDGRSVILGPCCPDPADEWELIPTANGYYSIRNRETRHFLDVENDATANGALLVTSAGTVSQSQLWLLRPTFFRGIDNALLEKQESLRVSQNTPWWKDSGQPGDLLAIFKNHGINMVRLRPSSVPPYVDPSASGCSGDACFAETDAQDLDLAQRARNLGMSVELSLLFDGGSSSNVPPAWVSADLQQAEGDIYSYVKSEIELYRSAGVLPDLVAIGNEVDTGFLGSLGSPTGAAFGNFAALQQSAMQAVQDAVSDPALGSPIPAPLTCIHITPAWDLTSFFSLANQNGIPYDMICQSYYPFFHGPLTDAQASAANPFNQPIEQDVLIAAATQLGKPILIIEDGEHYENGFDANDPWYPPSTANQRQFLIDLQTVVEGLPGQLGAGLEYWNPEGVNILAFGGPFYFNGGFPPNSIYIWNGLTLFNNADTSGSSNQNDPSYSEVLPGLDAAGNKLDPTLKYKFVSAAHTDLSLSTFGHGSTRALSFQFDSPATSRQEQWVIQSNNDGFFQVRSAVSSDTQFVLDGTDSNNTMAAQPNSSTAQEWDVQSLGGGLFQIVNRSSGLPAALWGQHLKFQITPTM